MLQKIDKVLIANRGEIAARIQRACDAFGVKCATICSEADVGSYFARTAHELIVIGPAPVAESYLSIEKIIAAAKKHKCDAVHPGYGFLSESAEFADAVIDAGLTFIGPMPESIRILGNKTAAREQVTKRGVPCTPGTPGGLDDKALVEAAKKVGVPLIIKASAGGGGRGMRVVHDFSELEEQLLLARGEAKKFFGNPEVYLERYIENPRHIEVQVFGDAHGNVVHMGTRDCSLQRRHQKLIEEAPAPNISDELREKLHQAAVEAALSVSYLGAGTVEFLVAGEEFFFLEMNTRIQVEHPVTEEVTGLDLVALQLVVATGEKLPIKQDAIQFSGHAIEYRVYAEDPFNNFQPAIGKITKLIRPTDSKLREDFAIEEGDSISAYYDALITKIIVRGENRNEAFLFSREILDAFEIEGVPTTLPFHKWAIHQNDFRKTDISISYVSEKFSEASLEEQRAAYAKDPDHIEVENGKPHIETELYRSEAFDMDYVIEITHRPDGLFFLKPKAEGCGEASAQYCRISNGRAAALNSIKVEVLDCISPVNIFS